MTALNKKLWCYSIIYLNILKEEQHQLTWSLFLLWTRLVIFSKFCQSHPLAIQKKTWFTNKSETKWLGILPCQPVATHWKNSLPLAVSMQPIVVLVFLLQKKEKYPYRYSKHTRTTVKIKIREQHLLPGVWVEGMSSLDGGEQGRSALASTPVNTFSFTGLESSPAIDDIFSSSGCIW